jgi:cell division protease FtsH
MIDEEVSKLIESQYQRALQILTDNKDKLTALAEQLLLTEVIFKEDLERIFGKRQWESDELVEVEKTSLTTETEAETGTETETEAETGTETEAEAEAETETGTDSSESKDTSTSSEEEKEG